MSASQVIQLVLIPHRPVHTTEEVLQDLAPALNILQSAPGLRAIWRGRKYEDRHTLVLLLLWTNLSSSHAFLTSKAYAHFHTSVQPALNGRKLHWLRHAGLLEAAAAASSSSSSSSPSSPSPSPQLSDTQHLQSILSSPAVEVALTVVKEGGVDGYYQQFTKVVVPILQEDPGCDGFFISPLVEDPHQQLLLINWKSVDAHHEDFEKRPTFKACIDALGDYYGEFVVPWHIVDLKLVSGGF